MHDRERVWLPGRPEGMSNVKTKVLYRITKKVMFVSMCMFLEKKINLKLTASFSFLLLHSIARKRGILM